MGKLREWQVFTPLKNSNSPLKILMFSFLLVLLKMDILTLGQFKLLPKKNKKNTAQVRPTTILGSIIHKKYFKIKQPLCDYNDY